MTIKPIKTDADHRAALARLDTIFDAAPGSPEGDEAEVLATLVRLYEEEHSPIDLPDPIDAIRFRMDQQGLRDKDLAPYIGSASKVSEVLSGRRNLSISMIRNLSEGLGIPADVLLGKPGAKVTDSHPTLLGKHFPISVMLKRGWFPGFTGTLAEAREQIDELLTSFVGPLGIDALRPALNRQRVRSNSKMDEQALIAWRIRIASLASRDTLPPYRAGSITKEVLRDIVRLSYLGDGPKLAKEFLNKLGIHMVIEAHLPKTHLDGAAMRLAGGAPVVALTLRYDRLDNFWFTLCHELAHVALHLDREDTDVFFDDLAQHGTDVCEKEADEYASEVLIPNKEWQAARLSSRPTREGVIKLAETLRISPAIPAGRIRYSRKDYTLFKDLVGTGRVRRLFAAA
jgi:HTH-type transcriptional regulator/antitoxin HigA